MRATGHDAGGARWYWRDLQVEVVVERLPTEPPLTPEVGEGWYDAKAHCLCIWTGFEWVCMPPD